MPDTGQPPADEAEQRITPDAALEARRLRHEEEKKRREAKAAEAKRQRAQQAQDDLVMLTDELGHTIEVATASTNNKGLDPKRRQALHRKARAVFGEGLDPGNVEPEDGPPKLSFGEAVEALLAQPRLTAGQQAAIRHVIENPTDYTEGGEPIALYNERTRADRLAETVRSLRQSQTESAESTNPPKKEEPKEEDARSPKAKGTPEDQEGSSSASTEAPPIKPPGRRRFQRTAQNGGAK